MTHTTMTMTLLLSQDCQHNTRGFHCEICAIGYHGDAGLGYQDSCQPCACPLATRSFAESCEVVRDDRGKEEHVCLHCSPGHSGRYCEMWVSAFLAKNIISNVSQRGAMWSIRWVRALT